MQSFAAEAAGEGDIQLNTLPLSVPNPFPLSFSQSLSFFLSFSLSLFSSLSLSLSLFVSFSFSFSHSPYISLSVYFFVFVIVFVFFFISLSLDLCQFSLFPTLLSFSVPYPLSNLPPLPVFYRLSPSSFLDRHNSFHFWRLLEISSERSFKFQHTNCHAGS